MPSKPTQTEIDEVLGLCYDQIDSGQSKYFGMTFEEGVVEAIRWLQGDSAEPPIDKEGEE